jgi:hypothetical protein
MIRWANLKCKPIYLVDLIFFYNPYILNDFIILNVYSSNEGL